MRETRNIVKFSAVKLEDTEILDLSCLGIRRIVGKGGIGLCKNLSYLNIDNNELHGLGIKGDEGSYAIPLSYHAQKLWKISAAKNPIHSLAGLSAFQAIGFLNLKHCNLTYETLASLYGTPIAFLDIRNNDALLQNFTVEEYRSNVIQILPDVWCLDGKMITRQEREEAKKMMLENKGNKQFEKIYEIIEESRKNNTMWKNKFDGCTRANHFVHSSIPEDPARSAASDTYRFHTLMQIYIEQSEIEKRYIVPNTRKPLIAPMANLTKLNIPQLVHRNILSVKQCLDLAAVFISALSYNVPKALLNCCLDMIVHQQFASLFDHSSTWPKLVYSQLLNDLLHSIANYIQYNSADLSLMKEISLQDKDLLAATPNFQQSSTTPSNLVYPFDQWILRAYVLFSAARIRCLNASDPTVNCKNCDEMYQSLESVIKLKALELGVALFEAELAIQNIKFQKWLKKKLMRSITGTVLQKTVYFRPWSPDYIAGTTLSLIDQIRTGNEDTMELQPESMLNDIPPFRAGAFKKLSPIDPADALPDKSPFQHLKPNLEPINGERVMLPTGKLKLFADNDKWDAAFVLSGSNEEMRWKQLNDTIPVVQLSNQMHKIPSQPTILSPKVGLKKLKTFVARAHSAERTYRRHKKLSERKKWYVVPEKSTFVVNSHRFPFSSDF